MVLEDTNNKKFPTKYKYKYVDLPPNGNTNTNMGVCPTSNDDMAARVFSFFVVTLHKYFYLRGS